MPEVTGMLSEAMEGVPRPESTGTLAAGDESDVVHVFFPPTVLQVGATTALHVYFSLVNVNFLHYLFLIPLLLFGF